MRKGIKILEKLISATILLLILFPLSISLLLSLPRIQNAVIQEITSQIEQHAGVRITIEHIDMGIFGRLMVDNLTIYDLQESPMIKVKSLDGHISAIELMRSRVSLNYGRISGGELNLIERESGMMNIQELVKMISSDRTAQGHFHLSIDNAKLEDFDLTIRRNRERRFPTGVDYSDMRYSIHEIDIEAFHINGPAIYASVERLRLDERSGFEVEDMSGKLYITGGALSIEELKIETPYSYLNLEYLRLVGDSWREYRDFIGNVTIEGAVRSSMLNTRDIAFFAPRLEGWNLIANDINIDASGTVDDMSLNLHTLRLAESTSITAQLSAKGLPHIDSSHFVADIELFESSADEINTIFAAIRGSDAPQEIHLLGESVKLSGHLEGMLDKFITDLRLKSSAGDLFAEGEWHNITSKEPTINARYAMERLSLGTILNDDRLGEVTAHGEMVGTFGGEQRRARLSGKVEGVDFMGYRYRDIDFTTELHPHKIDGQIFSHDKNLNIEIDGEIDNSHALPRYSVDATLHEVNFAALGINHRDSISQLTGKVSANITGSKVDEMSGEVTISDGCYMFDRDTTHFGEVYLAGESYNNERMVELKSDILDFAFRTKNSYGGVVEFLESSLYQYLPSLYSAPHESSTAHHEIVDSHSQLTLEVKEASPLFDAIYEGLQVAPGSKFNFMFNPSRKDITFSLSSDYVETKKLLALGINCNGMNRGDSLALYNTIGEIYYRNFHAADYSLVAGLKDDKIQMRSNYLNPENSSDAVIAAVAQLHHDSTAGRSMRLMILPSYITNNEGRWDISSKNISVDRSRIEIDNFNITSQEQSLTLDGIASTQASDSLQLSLHRFDLSFLSELIPTLGYKFNGSSNGRVVLYSAKRNARLLARVEIDSLSVNSLLAPPLNISAQWDRSREIARMAIIDRERGDTLARGRYAPNSGEYSAELQFDSLRMALIDPPLKGVLTNTEGYADASIQLKGQGRDVKIDGGVHVHDFETTVGYTQVKYRMPKADLVLDGERLICEHAEIEDTLGGKAHMRMEIDLRHLTNIGYNLTVQHEQLMVFNTTEEDNPIFYGKLFASGGAEIFGNKQGVKMNIAATTGDNSAFFMPLGGKSTISSADFIKFVEPMQRDTTSLLERKRMNFEREQRKASAGGDLEINMALDVRPNTEFQLVIDPTVGDVLRGRGEGRLNITINPRADIFDIYGDYSITEGSYTFTLRNIISKKFIIDSGSSIQWSGDPLDAQLDINAIYKLKTSLDPLLGDESTHTTPVECIIHLRDQLLRPDVEFDIKLPNIDSEQSAAVNNLLNDQESISRQFFYLMIANGFMPENSLTAGNTFGASTAATTGFELLTNQLSNWLSATNYNVVIRYRPESDSASEEVDFGFSRGLIGNRLIIELEGNYVADGSQEINENQTSNFMGEAYITWLIDNSGALKLKGFTQTIDRYDENQGLQETGIGIYYSEDFNNFKDLRERIKERFTSERARKRRQERSDAAAKKEEEEENENEKNIK